MTYKYSCGSKRILGTTILVFTLVASVYSGVFAQQLNDSSIKKIYNPCTNYDQPRPKPLMYEESKLTDKRERKFNKKRKRLSHWFNRENKSLWFDIKSFTGLTNYFEDTLKLTNCDSIWVFIAAYDNNFGAKYVPEGQNNKLTLIFHVKKDDVPHNFIISEGNFFEIPNKIFYHWTSKYDAEMSRLTPTLNKDDDENYDIPGDKKSLFSDTRCLRYLYANWKDYFIDEVQYQDCYNKANIIGIKAVFSAYTKDGNPNLDPKDGWLFKYRLHIIYEFTTKKHNKIVGYSIEKPTDYSARPTRQPFECLNLGGGGGNNGNLCPPGTGCPTP